MSADQPVAAGSNVAAGRSDRLPSWSLGRRLAAAVAVAGVLLLAVITVAVSVLISTRRAQDRVVRDYFNAVTESNDLFLTALDAETAIRGYVLSKSQDALEPLTKVDTKALARQTADLHRIFRSDPEVLSALNAATAAGEVWQEQWAQPTITAVAQHRAISPQETLQGKQLFDVLRARYDDFLTTVQHRREAALRDLHLKTNWLFGVVIAGAVAAGVIAIGLWWALRRWVSRPIDQLARDARQVWGGDLEHVVRASGPPDIVALARDIDDMRRSLVDQVATARAAGEQVEAARLELEQQAADLERSNQELEQFAYVASHDLQEPLRKVASFCQMLERRYRGQLDERADQYIAFAVDGAKRMQLLINDLLAFSRVGRVTSSQTDVDMDDCLRSALRSLETLIEESAADVSAEPLPTVHGEAGLLTLLLQNLIGNAVKFRGEADPRVRLTVRRNGEEWEFACSDNGIGIEQQYAERVFVIFQRLHPKERYEGTGIGLAMCKKIVEYHGGRIWVDSDGDFGTTIRWTLPVVATDEETAKQTADDTAATVTGDARVSATQGANT
jgi:signal transduction histidine kinase